MRIEGSADPALVRVLLECLRAMIGLPANTRIWIAAGVTDLRRGFTGLSALVQTQAGTESVLGSRVRVSRPARRSDQSSVVRRRWVVFVRQAAGARTFRVAASGERHGVADASAVIDAAGRHRLAAAGAHLGAAAVGVTCEILLHNFFRAEKIENAKCSCDTPRMSVTTLPDLNALPAEALRALILAQHEQLLSREREIEHLKLLLAKLQRMQFGRKSEKLTRQIEQLELRLEDLQSNRSEKECNAAEPAAVTSLFDSYGSETDASRVARASAAPNAPTSRKKRCVRNAAASCASWAKMSPRCWSTCRPVSW